MKIESSYVIAFLLAIICCLAGLDLWRQIAIKSEEYWYTKYILAVKSSYDFWKKGFRIEDLELKVHSQNQHFIYFQNSLMQLEKTLSSESGSNSLRYFDKKKKLYDQILKNRKILVHLNTLKNNNTHIYQIRCENDGFLLRVGLNDFRTDSRDVCQIFTSTTSDYSASNGPHTMFESIPLAEKNFALKSLATGLFVTAVAPPQDNSAAPWKLMISGSVIGSAETFRLTEENYLYSGLVGLNCFYLHCNIIVIL
jgi:hypothetical protein